MPPQGSNSRRVPELFLKAVSLERGLAVGNALLPTPSILYSMTKPPYPPVFRSRKCRPEWNAPALCASPADTRTSSPTGTGLTAGGKPREHEAPFFEQEIPDVVGYSGVEVGVEAGTEVVGAAAGRPFSFFRQGVGLGEDDS